MGRLDDDQWRYPAGRGDGDEQRSTDARGQADDDGGPFADATDQAAAQKRHRASDDGHGKQGQSGVQGIEAVTSVQGDGKAEDRAVEAEVEDHPERDRDRKRGLAKQDGVDHRVLDDALNDGESHRARNASGQQRECEPPIPSLAAGDDEAAGQRRQGDGGNDLAREVEWMTVARRLGNMTAKEFRGHGRDRHIDQEDRAPAKGGGDDAAEDRSGGQADARRATPHAERATALSGVRKHMGDERQRAGHQRRGTSALDHTRNDESRQRCRARAGGAAHGEDREADEEPGA